MGPDEADKTLSEVLFERRIKYFVWSRWTHHWATVTTTCCSLPSRAFDSPQTKSLVCVCWRHIYMICKRGPRYACANWGYPCRIRPQHGLEIIFQGRENLVRLSATRRKFSGYRMWAGCAQAASVSKHGPKLLQTRVPRRENWRAK